MKPVKAAPSYVLENNFPWGDYGDTLGAGMSSEFEMSRKPVRLQRTGPFVPPLTLPGFGGIVVVTDVPKEAEVVADEATALLEGDY